MSCNFIYSVIYVYGCVFTCVRSCIALMVSLELPGETVDVLQTLTFDLRWNSLTILLKQAIQGLLYNCSVLLWGSSIDKNTTVTVLFGKQVSPLYHTFQIINVKNDVYKNGYRRRSCMSKTAKIHHFMRFVMYCFITTVLVAFCMGLLTHCPILCMSPRLKSPPSITGNVVTCEQWITRDLSS